jgi:hypothetical protein
VAAIFLNASWSLHNVIAWMKLKPFLSKWWSRFFIGTVILVQPYWIVEIYANFTYFHNINKVFLSESKIDRRPASCGPKLTVLRNETLGSSVSRSLVGCSCSRTCLQYQKQV